MRILFRLLLLPLASLAACATPPQDAYIDSKTSQAAVVVVPLGIDAAGKTCEQQAQPNGDAFIFCGEWSQPSGHVVHGPAGPLNVLATASPWRTGIDHRFDCADPRPATVLGDIQAVVLDCRRKIGGWPQVGLIAIIGDKAYFADGLRPELPVIERSIGILSGKLTAQAAVTMAGSPGLAAERLAAQSFSSNDVGQYEALMRAGAAANLAQNYGAAEKAYRAALILQQKALGAGNLNTVSPLMHEALQISDEGRYSEAEALFARADALVRQQGLTDKASLPRLWHYEALHLTNQGKWEQALALFERAEAGYAALLPPEMLSTQLSVRAAAGSAAALSDRLASQGLLADPVAEAAMVGVIETRRNRAVTLKWLGRLEESEAAAKSATDLARARGISQPEVAARLYRTSAVAAESQGRYDAALEQLAQSAAAFTRAMPGARPVAETELLRAAALMRLDRPEEALLACRDASSALEALKAGIEPRLMETCLAAFATIAQKDTAQRQALLAEMFEVAQLAQNSITSQQIARATARLAENARDPRVGEAIRRREDANSKLADLYRARDTLDDARRSGVQTSPEETADLDKKIIDALANEADADAALQEASPNYGQLVQQVVKASDVLAILRPGEAFAATVLGADTGWTFLLRDGKIALAPIDGGTKRLDALVARARAGIEPTSGSTPPTFDVAAARQLYDVVLGGVGSALEGATALTVAPSGPLLSYPFAALLTGPADPAALADAPWLIKRMTVSHVPAAANFVALRKVAGGSRAERPWFGFGDFRQVSLHQAEASFPAHSCADSARLLAGLPLLAGARAELDQARQLEQATARDELLGFDFTAAAVRKADLKDYRILHFATHALLPTDLTCQDEPAIVTSTAPGAPDASGALLTASSVASLQLDADTVILSACNTGGPNGGEAGESLSGLARSFFYAGARSLLVTHWPVNDQITRILVVSTLAHYKEHPRQGLAMALSEAQRGLIGEARGNLAALAHPYYWAPLALIGESNPAGAVVASHEVPGAHLAGL
jgi:CHAT domain-containing protein